MARAPSRLRSRTTQPCTTFDQVGGGTLSQSRPANRSALTTSPGCTTRAASTRRSRRPRTSPSPSIVSGPSTAIPTLRPSSGRLIPSRLGVTAVLPPPTAATPHAATTDACGSPGPEETEIPMSTSRNISRLAAGVGAAVLTMLTMAGPVNAQLDQDPLGCASTGTCVVDAPADADNTSTTAAIALGAVGGIALAGAGMAVAAGLHRRRDNSFALPV